MDKVVLYLMNYRGLCVLQELIRHNFRAQINFIVSAEDKNITNDYYEEIEHICNLNQIPFYNRKKEIPTYEGFALAVGWRWLIEQKDKLIVLHDSILPKYRGFNPLVTALINGDGEIGVTALFAGKEFDRGDIIEQNIKAIAYPIKIQKAIELVSDLCVALCLKIFNKIKSRQPINSCPQNEQNASYSLWRDEEDYRIDWQQDVAYIKRFIDATGFPYKGASSIVSSETIRILESQVEEDVKIANRQPGKVLFLTDGFPTIVCGNGLLTIKDAIFDKDKKSFLPLRKFRVRFK